MTRRRAGLLPRHARPRLRTIAKGSTAGSSAPPPSPTSRSAHQLPERQPRRRRGDRRPRRQGRPQRRPLPTDDLDATFEKLRSAEAEIVQEPTDQPWGTPIAPCAIRPATWCASTSRPPSALRRQPRPDPRPGRAGEQPQGRQRRDPEAPADGVHGRLRLGQELARLRHDRRRVAAADQRDLQRLPAGLHADAGAARGRRARRADDRDHSSTRSGWAPTPAPRSAPSPTPTRCCASSSAGSASRRSARPRRSPSTSTSVRRPG